MKVDIETVHASGDLTGTTDTRRIRDAVATLSPWGVLRLVEGPETGFSINDTLTLNGVRIECDTLTDLTWRGPECGKYMLVATGKESHVRNLRLNCQQKCWGLKCSTQYGHAWQHLHIRESIGVGLDCVDTWASHGSHLVFAGCHGITWRMSRCNSSTFEHTRVYDCRGDKWPAEYAERACIVMVDGGNTVLRHLICEPLSYGADPAIYCENYAGSLQQLRFEQCDMTDVYVRVHGKPPYFGQAVGIEDVSVSSSVKLVAFCRETGTASGTEIRRLMAQGIVPIISIPPPPPPPAG